MGSSSSPSIFSFSFSSSESLRAFRCNVFSHRGTVNETDNEIYLLKNNLPVASVNLLKFTSSIFRREIQWPNKNWMSSVAMALRRVEENENEKKKRFKEFQRGNYLWFLAIANLSKKPTLKCTIPITSLDSPRINRHLHYRISVSNLHTTPHHTTPQYKLPEQDWNKEYTTCLRGLSALQLTPERRQPLSVASPKLSWQHSIQCSLSRLAEKLAASCNVQTTGSKKGKQF